ncbi:MAG: LysR family transcriptional regulator [Salinicola sp.]|nr:LysR family transcriptional regulator [Salinicola sp.]
MRGIGCEGKRQRDPGGRTLEFKHLRTFLAVAEAGNVTHAATLLHLVQPAVSRHLKLLEEELGTPLFHRERQGMRLTASGHTLLDYARRALQELERARDEIRPDDGRLSGVVTIGLLPSVCDLIASPLIRRLQQAHPDIQPRISMGYAGHLHQWLESGEIDIALSYAPRQAPAIDTEPLLEEALWAIGLPHHALQATHPISLETLVSHPLILPTPRHGLRQLLDLALIPRGLQARVAVETDAMSIQKRLVLEGHGVSILPGIAVAEDLREGRLTAAPIEAPGLKRRIVLAHSTNRQVSRAVAGVENALKQCVKQVLNEGRWPMAQRFKTS